MNYRTSRGRTVLSGLTDRGRTVVGVLTDDGLPIIETGPAMYYKEVTTSLNANTSSVKQPPPPILSTISQITNYLHLNWS